MSRHKMNIFIALLGYVNGQSHEETMMAYQKKLHADRLFVESTAVNEGEYEDYFGTDDSWNDNADLWINSDDYLESDEDYMLNREMAHDKRLEQSGYIKDPNYPEQPAIALHPDPNYRVEHIVKTPPMPPGFAYSIRHCVAQSAYGPIYKFVFNKCLDTRLEVQRHAPGIAFGDSRLTFRKFRFLGIPGQWNQKIRYACKISLCSTTIFGHCSAGGHNCPQPPPEMPSAGEDERRRFFAPGYRGLNEAQMAEPDALKPFSGLLDQKPSDEIWLKTAEVEPEKTQFGFKLHNDKHIFKKMNVTVDVNGTETVIESLEKIEPQTGSDVKLGIARHLFQNGVKIKDLLRMNLLSSFTDLQTQSDYAELKSHHMDSEFRHKKPAESQREYRRRLRSALKAQRAADPNYMSPKESRRKRRMELRALLRNDAVVSNKLHLDYDS